MTSSSSGIASTRFESAREVVHELGQLRGGGADVAGGDLGLGDHRSGGSAARSAAAISSVTWRIEARRGVEVVDRAAGAQRLDQRAQLGERGVDRGRDVGDLLALHEGVDVADERGCRARPARRAAARAPAARRASISSRSAGHAVGGGVDAGDRGPASSSAAARFVDELRLHSPGRRASRAEARMRGELGRRLLDAALRRAWCGRRRAAAPRFSGAERTLSSVTRALTLPSSVTAFSHHLLERQVGDALQHALRRGWRRSRRRRARSGCIGFGSASRSSAAGGASGSSASST